MQRPLLFFIIACATMLWAFMQQSPKVMVLSFLGLVVVGVLIELYSIAFVKHRRSLAVTKFLEAGDVDRFLAEIDNDLEKEKTKVYKDMLFVNKSAGLYFKGRPREALQLLDQVNVRKLPKVFRRLYFNNRLASLILNENFNEGQELVNKNPDVFKMAEKPGLIDHALKGNLAVLAFHQDDHEKCRRMLTELLKVKRPRFYASAAHLYLGSIELKKGHTEEARVHLKEAAEAAPATYIAERAQRLLTYL